MSKDFEDIKNILEVTDFSVSFEDLANCIEDITDNDFYTELKKVFISKEEINDINIAKASLRDLMNEFEGINQQLDIKKLNLKTLKLIILMKFNYENIVIRNVEREKVEKIINQLKNDLLQYNRSLYYPVLNSDGFWRINEHSKHEIITGQKKEEEKNKKRIELEEKLKKFSCGNDEFEKLLLKSLSLTDLRDIICNNSFIGDLLKDRIIYNTIRKKNMNYTQSQIFKIMNSGVEVNSDDYMEELRKAIIENANDIDFNKLLLASAYRCVEVLEKNSINYDSFNNANKVMLDNYMAMILVISKALGKTKVTINALGIEGGEKAEETIVNKEGTRRKIFYNVDMLKQDAEKIIEWKYYSNIEQETIARKLTDGSITFNEIDFKVVKLIKLSENQIVDAIKSSEENFKWYINNEKLPENKIVSMFRLYENPSLDLIEFFMSKVNKNNLPGLYCDGTIKTESLTALKDEDKINIEKLFDISTLLKDSQSAETVFKLKNDNLLSKNTIKNYITDDMLKIVVQNGDIEYLLKLYEFDLITLEKIREYIDDDKIIKEFENGQRDINKLLKLYVTGIVTDEAVNLLVDEYKLDKEIIDKFINEDIIQYKDIQKLELNVNIDNITGIIKEEQEKEQENEEGQIDKNKLYKAKSVIAYMIDNGKISEEEINKIYKAGIITEEDLFEFAKKGYFKQEIISRLYTSCLISEERLKELAELGVLSEEQKNEAIKQLDIEKIEENAKIALGLRIPDLKKGDYTSSFSDPIYGMSNQDKKSDIVINPLARDLLIKSYGAHLIEREGRDEEDDKSPFDNYEFYIIADSKEDINPDSIILAERYYIDRLSDEKKLATGNATYMFRFKDLARIGKKSKYEINDIMINGTDESVLKTNHVIKTSEKQPRGWAGNLTYKVNKWKKGKKYKSENVNITEKWILNIDGVVNNKTGKWTRTFDVYSDTGESVDYDER